MDIFIEELYLSLKNSCCAVAYICTCAMISGLTQLIHFVTEKTEVITQHLQKYDYQGWALKFIVAYSFFVEQLNTYTKYAHDNSPAFRFLVKYMQYYILYTKCFVMDRRVEPISDDWISVSMLTVYYEHDTTANDITYFINENYHIFDYSTDGIEDAIFHAHEFTRWQEGVISLMKSEKNVIESLVTMKYNDKYTHKVCSKDTLMQTSNTFVPSNVKFLSIEYSYPGSDTPIVLEMNSDEYIVGNEILSKTFVKRMLEYQVNTTVFHHDYVLSIMDNNIDTFELKMGEYIILEKDRYTIVRE